MKVGKKRLSLSTENKPKIFSAARGGSPAAQETFAKKKLKTSVTACEDSLVAPKLVINLTSSKGEKEKVARSI